MQAVSSGVPENVLEGLLWPCTPAEFAASIRQHSALLIQRESSRSFYSEIFSSEELWKLLKEREVQYGTNVDVTLFTAEQRRQTFNDNLIKGQPAGEHAPLYRLHLRAGSLCSKTLNSGIVCVYFSITIYLAD